MNEDKKLTDNFSIFDLTKTSHDQYQEMNRNLTNDQIYKLGQLARLLEHVLYVLKTGIQITSGYRCPELNTAVGSTNKSQHLLCEACDFIPIDKDIDSSFKILWDDVKNNGSNVGQLIYETMKRDNGIVSWIHISLGTPYRDISKCKQILKMQDGKYEHLA